MAREGGGDIGDTDPTQQIAGGVATGGEIGWGAVRADLAGVFTQGAVAHVMQPVLDLLVPAPQLLQPRSARLLGREAGAGLRPFLADGTGLGAADVLDVAVDATDLGQP